MFLEKYLNPENMQLIKEEYEESYITSMNEKNFLKVCSLLKKNNIYCIDDIIVNYLDLFMMDESKLESKLEKLKEQLGKNYSFIIGNDLRYIGNIMEDIS